ncbi:MAG: 50S ribosomal protein L13 [Flammeovirgaceae bacterium]
MDTLSYKTKFANNQTVTKEWLLVDAKDAVLGRLTSRVAFLLRGKHKPYFTPHTLCGDHVVIINAEKVRMTGRKWDRRKIYTYSGHPGGQRTHSPRSIQAKNPARLLEHAIKGMLPKGPLGYEMFRHVHIYVGANHPHASQSPKEIKL